MKMVSFSRSTIIVFFINLALLSILFSLTQGSSPLSLYQLWLNDHQQLHTILFLLRLPRALTAFVTGGLLALAGSLMQLLVQNPLADPYVLGISGGAACFVLLLMMFGLGDGWLIGGAWMGSLLTIALLLLLARHHHWQTHRLLLSGIALACGFSAVISFIFLISPANNLHSMLFWLTGDLNDHQFPWLGLAILWVGLIICLLLAKGFNLLVRGDQVAQVLGLPCQYYRIALFLLSSLFTATAVTLAGCIGFIGLIVPHLARRLCGYDHRMVFPISVLLGGTLLTVADTLARTLWAPQQIPVGILTAFMGVPIFIWLLQA